MEGKLALHLRTKLLVPLDADDAAASGGSCFFNVNFLWHVSWMCLSPYLLHVNVLPAADIKLDADKGRQPIHARASCDFLVMHGARAVGSSIEVVRVWPDRLWTQSGPSGVFNVAAVDLTSCRRRREGCH